MDKTKGQDLKVISFKLLELESTAFSVKIHYNGRRERGREQSRKKFNKTLCQTEILPTFQTG